MSKKPTKIVRRYPTPALEKGLDILELFASEPAGLTKSDVARRLGRTISEIFRMLLCLEERGYISRSRDGERWRRSTDRNSNQKGSCLRPVPLFADT